MLMDDSCSIDNAKFSIKYTKTQRLGAKKGDHKFHSFERLRLLKRLVFQKG